MLTLANARLPQLKRCVPNIFSFSSVLYVGASPTRAHYLKKFKCATVLEVWKPYCQRVADRYNVQVLNANILDARLHLLCNSFELVFWWNGPEHVRKKDLRKALSICEQIASKMVVLGAPYGRRPQGKVDSNPHQMHKFSVYPKLLRNCRYSVNVTQRKPFPKHIVAWKEI